MTDTPAQPPGQAEGGARARRRSRAAAQPPDLLMFDLLGVLARRFGADPASFLTEVNAALELRDAVHRV